MTVSDSYDKLAEQARQEFPRSWVPEKDDDTDLITGGFVRLDEGSTAYGPCKIAVIRTKDGEERAIWLLHHVLRGEFKRVRPKPGELVAVRYLGRKMSASGHDYSSYRVVVQRDDTEPDWDALEDSDDVGGGEW